MKVYMARKGTKVMATSDVSKREPLKPYKLKEELETSFITSDHIKIHNNPEYFWETVKKQKWEKELAQAIFSCIEKFGGYLFTRDTDKGTISAILVNPDDVEVLC